MTSTLLKLLDFFKPLFQMQGVDYDQLRTIVGIKLEMDNRRVSAYRYQQTESANAAFAWTFVIYFIFGGFLSFMLAFVPSILFAYTIYHAYLMVMITMTLISDFSAVLLDTSDNTIVLPRPISNKTFYAARATHIMIYIGLISLALTTVPIVVTFVKHGVIVGLAMLATTLLTVLFSVALTNGLYLFLMRFTSEERLKNLINYFQIGMAIFMMGGYQILPRLFSDEIVENLSVTAPWWSVLIPPMWMAVALQTISDWNLNWISITNLVLAITMPVLVWKAVNQYLTPYFTQKLADLGTSSSKQSEKKAQQYNSINARGSALATTGLEKASFNLASFGFARDRKLKLRMYPAFGYFVVLAFILLFRSKEKTQTVFQYLSEIGETQMHLTAIYACIYVILTAAYEIHYTDDFKAAWIFQSAPIQKPGELLIGNLKAILVRFFLPLYGVASILILSIWPASVIIDLVFGFFVCFFLMLLFGIIGDKHLPLSLPSNTRAQGSSMARAILAMLVIVGVGFGHYFLNKIEFATLIICPTLPVLCWFLLKRYKKVTWEDIGI
jgi:ABC-2 type transport system permease protein